MSVIIVPIGGFVATMGVKIISTGSLISIDRFNTVASVENKRLNFFFSIGAKNKYNAAVAGAVEAPDPRAYGCKVVVCDAPRRKRLIMVHRKRQFFSQAHDMMKS